VTVSLTYDNTLARVRVNATGLGTATSAAVQRSLNQVVWTTVRGASEVAVTAGVLATVDDYEFASDVVNYYRVVYPNAITFINAGTAVHAANASVTPTVPASSTTGDLLLIWAATRSSGQGVPAVPTGYQLLIDAANARLFGKIHDGSEPNPTVTFTGTGGATMSFSAQMATFRNAQLAYVDAAGALNATAQNIAVPDLTVTRDNSVVLALGWKQDDWTSVTSPSGFTEIGEPSTTLGDDQGITWGRLIQTNALPVTSAVFTVTGGATAVSRGIAMSIPPTTATQSSSITPSLDGVWLKSLGRPFLNRQLSCAPNPGTISRENRGPISATVGHSLPSAGSELRSSRRLTIDLVFTDTDDRLAMNVILGTGDPLFIHTPLGHPLPTMNVIVEDSTETRPLLNRLCNRDLRVFTLPLVEVAAPGAGVMGSTSTWQTVIDEYASWAAVVADKSTWLALIEIVGSVNEVVVP
jgi:hypothetical protein